MIFADASSLSGPVMMAIKLLAVVGGVAVGAIFFDLLARGLARWFLAKTLPRPAKIMTRIFGGGLVGGLIFLWMFAGGDGGFGGSGGGWMPFGQGGGKGNTNANSSGGKDKESKGKGSAEPLRIHVLGGKRVVDQRFYVIDNEQPRTLSELRSILLDRQHKNPDWKEIEILIYTDSVDRDNPAVTDVEKFARENGLTPKLSQPDRKAP